MASVLGLTDTAAEISGEIADAVDIDAAVEIGFVKRAYRRGTAGIRFRTAAWKFLRPQEPHWDDLKALAKSVGADHMNLPAFCGRLRDECNEIVREHSDLKRWVCRRLALLDAVVVSRKLDRSRRDEVFALRNALSDCTELLVTDPAEATYLSENLCQAAILGAGNAVVDAIAEVAGLNANLMFSVPCGYRVSGSAERLANQDRADRLWQNVGDHTHRLVVLAESTGASHVGFWVPVIPSGPGVRLPGATEAIAGNASLVLKEDLPPLRGFSHQMESDWEAYMQREFNHDLFLSLPVRVPGRSTPVAVLNVNVNVRQETKRHWYRAYGAYWTRQAEEYAWEFLDLALRGMMLVAQRSAGMPALDCGVPRPAAAMLLPASTEVTEP